MKVIKWSKMHKFFLIIISIILISGIIATPVIINVLKEENINNKAKKKEEQEKKELLEKKSLYEEIISNFEPTNKDYLENNIDGKGIYAWQNVYGDTNKFKDEYLVIDSNYKPADGAYHGVRHEEDIDNKDKKFLATEDMNIRIYNFFNSINATFETSNDKEINVEKMGEDLYKVSTKMNVTSGRNNKREINFDFVFYMDKIIDIIFTENDNSKTDLFISYYSNEDLRKVETVGRYIQKKDSQDIFSDIQAELIFEENGVVIYRVFSQSYSTTLLSFDNLSGTYEVDKNKVTITITDKIVSENETQILNTPETRSFNLSGLRSRIGNTSHHFVYQKANNEGR